jgi:hypothetical protein
MRNPCWAPEYTGRLPAANDMGYLRLNPHHQFNHQLVAFLPLNEAPSGRVRNLVDGGYGTVYSPAVVPYKEGRVYSFSSASTYIDFGNPDWANPGTGDFTISFWSLQTSFYSATDFAMTKGGYTAALAGYAFEFGSGAWATAVADGTNTIGASVVASPSVNTWYCIGLSIGRAFNAIETYGNGRYVNGASISGYATFSGSSSLKIATDNASYIYAGSVYMVRMHKRYIDQVEHSNMYRNPFGTIDNPVFIVEPRVKYFIPSGVADTSSMRMAYRFF